MIIEDKQTNPHTNGEHSLQSTDADGDHNFPTTAANSEHKPLNTDANTVHNYQSTDTNDEHNLHKADAKEEHNSQSTDTNNKNNTLIKDDNDQHNLHSTDENSQNNSYSTDNNSAIDVYSTDDNGTAETRKASPIPSEVNNRNMQVEPKLNRKQVMGCLSAHSINFAYGVAMAYTSALIPALQESDSEIKTTLAQSAWLASTVPIAVPFGAIASGFIMEHLGRLTAIQTTIIPFCVSWIVTATAHNFMALIAGRILVGLVFGVAHSASNVLITETALKKYRGVLTCSAISFSSLGVLCSYILGAFLEWRTCAWVSLITPLIPFLFICIFTAESPVWLRSRGRLEKARRSSMYYYNDPDYVVLSTTPQPSAQTQSNNDDVEKTRENVEKPTKPSFMKQVWWLLSLPSGYKPLIILNVLFFLQQLSGNHITMAYAVTFFQQAGSTFNPYYATIMVGLVRAIACTVTVVLLRVSRRRILILISCIGMAISMVVSAYTTGLALADQKAGTHTFTQTWIPILFIILYVLMTSLGLLSIPWTMMAELYPQRVRGAAQTVNMIGAHLFMFGALQMYPTMDYYLGGSGVQYLFAGASLLAALIVWIFCPETHGKTLSEIENYFAHNTVYLCGKS